METDKNASQGVGVRLKGEVTHPLCSSQYGGELTTASSKTKTPALQATKETAHKETDVRLWVDHLNHTETRRKHEARRAAEKRRSRKENNNKGTAC